MENENKEPSRQQNNDYFREGQTLTFTELHQADSHGQTN